MPAGVSVARCLSHRSSIFRLKGTRPTTSVTLAITFPSTSDSCHSSPTYSPFRRTLDPPSPHRPQKKTTRLGQQKKKRTKHKGEKTCRNSITQKEAVVAASASASASAQARVYRNNRGIRLADQLLFMTRLENIFPGYS